MLAENLDTFTRAMVILGGFAFNGKGGTAVVRLILSRFPDITTSLHESRSSAYAMGLMIGILERFILFLMVLLGHWGALGFVIAAKSIARFKELDEKSKAVVKRVKNPMCVNENDAFGNPYDFKLRGLAGSGTMRNLVLGVRPCAPR